jgi:hypothetical protein
MDLLINRLITRAMVTIEGFSLRRNSQRNRQTESALGFSGRSEIIRAGTRNLLAEEQERQDLSMHALLLTIYDRKSDKQITEMRQDYDKLINTHSHSKFDGEQMSRHFSAKRRSK